MQRLVVPSKHSKEGFVLWYLLVVCMLSVCVIIVHSSGDDDMSVVVSIDWKMISIRLNEKNEMIPFPLSRMRGRQQLSEHRIEGCSVSDIITFHQN